MALQRIWRSGTRTTLQRAISGATQSKEGLLMSLLRKTQKENVQLRMQLREEQVQMQIMLTAHKVEIRAAKNPRPDLHIGGHRLCITELDGWGARKTGWRTWECAYVLARHIEHTGSFDFQGKSVLELGSGTGVCGVAAALLGADVTCSGPAHIKNLVVCEIWPRHMTEIIFA
jgi:ribosomal protein L11 methylase PrmA